MSFQEIHEVAVLRHNDNIRLSGGIEDLAIFSVPEIQVSDRTDFDLNFRESQTANEARAARPTRFSSC